MTYQNSLASPDDLRGWIAEGPVGVEHMKGGMVLSSTADEAALIAQDRGDHAHFTYWCPEIFDADIQVSWDFKPLAGEGLAMLFFAATGTENRDLFDPGLAPRTGYYPQYHSGDISTLHVSYYRRKWPTERRFHTCNLRKSPGFRLVTQGADPLPPLADIDGHYRISVTKQGASISFAIDDLILFSWEDPEPLGGGRIGFRQMTPLTAHYRNLEVSPLS